MARLWQGKGTTDRRRTHRQPAQTNEQDCTCIEIGRAHV